MTDPLEAFLADAQHEPPPDLARRILAGVNDPAAQRRLYWADVAEATRKGLVLSAAGLLVSAGLAWSVLSAPASGGVEVVADQAPTEQRLDDSSEVLDPLAVTAVSLEAQIANAYPLLGEE